MISKKMTTLEKMQYVIPKFKNINKQIDNYYSNKFNLFPLFRAISAHIFIDFRNNLDSHAHAPYRIKNELSMKNKIKKILRETWVSIFNSECTKDSIDSKLSSAMNKIIKDIFGLTLVLHTDNNIKKSYSNSPDKKIQMLLKQLRTVEAYLNFCTDHSPNSAEVFDITSTFIDNSDIGIQNIAPKFLPPLVIDNIETWEDYYTSLISLLTLLTNLSTPCNYSTDGQKHNYCVSQINFPFLDILHFDGVIDPNDSFKSIKNLLNIAKNTYNGKLTPFDEQLDFALKSQKKSKQDHSYYDKIDPQVLLNCKIQLQYLKENLESILNDRLSSYVMEKDVPNIIKNISEELQSIGINVKILSSYTKARSNGYISTYIIIELENKLRFELQLITEFRYQMGRKGNSAHNISRSNKSIDIMNLFSPSDSLLSEEDFHTLLDFLNNIDYADITPYKTSPSNELVRQQLIQLIDYAKSKIKLKDYIEITDSNGVSKTISVADYITNLIKEKSPYQGRISAAHNIIPNEARVTTIDKIYSLQELISTNFHSVLSDFLIKSYQEKADLGLRVEESSTIFSPGNIIYDISAANKIFLSKAKNFIFPKYEDPASKPSCR